MSFTAVASYTAPVRRPIEPVGPYFLAHATRTLKGHSWSEYELMEAEKNVVTVEEKDSDEALFDVEINDPELLSHDPRDWKTCDLYAALGLSQLRSKATPEQIVKAHRRAVLQHHPDKKSSSGGSLDQDGFFKIIQKAYETLLDPSKRRQFDSVDDSADVPVPTTKAKTEEEFYAAWGPVFVAEARFSTKQPVPTLGDANSTKEEVESFYKFWNNLDSWRTFEWLDEDVPDDTANRDHKRYIEKKNNNARKKRKTDDNKRLSDLVKKAQSEDPRIKKFKDAEKAEKAQKKWEKEAGARAEAEAAKAKAEAEAKAKEEAEAKAKSDKESAKKAKEAAKSAKKKNKRSIRGAAKDNEYFGDAANAEKIDADIEALIDSFDDMKLSEVATKLKDASAAIAKTVFSELAAEQVATGTTSTLRTMETPPLKKQRIDSNDIILSSPLQEKPEIADVVEVANNTEFDHDKNDDHESETNLSTPLETPKKHSELVSEQNDTLSPLKPQEENSVPSFKQLISRFNALVENATSNLETVATNTIDESALPLVQFASLQNKYENSINSLNVQLHEKLSRINELNNEICDYRQKIENMHLTIEESAAENSKLQKENESLKMELKELETAIGILEKQLSVEKNKSSNLISKISQLKESVEPIFNAYESLHEKIASLRDQNAELQNTANLQYSKIASFDDTLKNELESLAQELYIQYAEKHESKISKLRAAYEAKYTQKQSLFTEKHRLLQSQYETLQQELSHIKSRLQVEASEKRQLVRLWDEYVALDKKDVDQMASFVKKLK